MDALLKYLHLKKRAHPNNAGAQETGRRWARRKEEESGGGGRGFVGVHVDRVFLLGGHAPGSASSRDHPQSARIHRIEPRRSRVCPFDGLHVAVVLSPLNFFLFVSPQGMHGCAWMHVIGYAGVCRSFEPMAVAKGSRAFVSGLPFLNRRLASNER